MASIPEQMAERRMLPVIVASTLGTTIEWYDFFLYGTVAALLQTFKGSYVPVALYIVILAAFSFIATLGLKEMAHVDISD
jgi:hypothetical protein